MQWVQPDGTVLSLRVFGDEFYARTTTAEGYTVVFNEADKTYYFAESGTQTGALVSSGVKAHKQPPAGLVKHLQEADGIVAAIRAARIDKFAPDRALRWERRREAVSRQRALDRAQSRADAEAAKSASNISNTANADADATQFTGDAQSQVNALAVSGGKVGLMILAQFPDDPATAANDPVNFPTTQAKMARYSNEIGYTDDGNTGSIRDYFSDQSLGSLDFTQVVSVIITLPQPRSYYNFSNYPTNTLYLDAGTAGRRLVTDAVAVLKASGFDFSGLTVDTNKRVLATSLMFAGNFSGVWAQGLWPHAWTLAPQINVGTISNPRYIYFYQITHVPNASPVIGTMCHELGHLVLDYPDFYDTDAADGASEGVGEHSLMGSGNYLNGGRTPAPIDLYLKDYSGWTAITELVPGAPTQRTLTAGNYGYRIRKPGSSSEYFLIENRSNDDRWATHSPDKGIAIWHVDEAVTTANKRQQMTNSQHYELSLEQADGLYDMEANRNRGDNKDLYDSFKRFDASTTPNSRWWNGTASQMSLQVLNPPGTPVMHLQFFSDTVQTPIATALDTAGIVWGEEGLVFTPGSWFGQLSAAAHDGVDAATHYPIADSQEASVATVLAGPGSLTFWWKVSSEQYGDYLHFYRDDLELPAAAPISGDTGWQQITIPIPAGSHAVRWTYAKNASVAMGEDAAWLDQVVFTPGPLDSDGDGLTDDEESLLGTNPHSVDSDDDGLVDGAGGRVPLSVYPTGIDGDGDGFVDGEADYGTDPNISNMGDLAPRGNPDNVINTGDLLILTRFVNGLSEPNAVEALLGDIDGDGDLDIGDLILLQHTLMQGSPP
jgi:M6 family metalloprotease-like protein